MGDINQAEEVSKTAILPHDDGPDKRSVYPPGFDLNKVSVELYKVKDIVYLKGPRGVDQRPYKIHEVLGDGQYRLSRDGKSSKVVYHQEKLSSLP